MWNCTHFRHPTDEQLGHVDIFFSNYYYLLSVYFEFELKSVKMQIGINRPFYRYGGHVELIQFKEYYRMPMGHEHISFVFSSAFRDIFLKVFLE